jgi:hypothetical protein
MAVNLQYGLNVPACQVGSGAVPVVSFLAETWRIVGDRLIQCHCHV